MDIDNALKILKLNNNYNKNNIYELSLNQLKKAYHIQALLFHPDKNNNCNAVTEFRKIQESYEYLCKVLNSSHNFTEDYESENIEKYSELILNFINLILNNINNNPEKLREIEKDIKKFKSDCIDYSYTLIEIFLNNLNIEIIEEIYLFLSILSKNENEKLKIINNISQSSIDMLINILEKKLQDFNIYIITPTLKNILNNEIYKLTIKDEIVYIPLWHKELNYENNIIKIQPNLRENEKIDENNNLILKYNTNYENIIEKLRNDEFPNLEIKLDNELNLKIPLNELKFIKNQYYFFKNNGISLINNKEIMDISKKGNIIIELIIL
jgi:hypothetical protein